MWTAVGMTFSVLVLALAVLANPMRGFELADESVECRVIASAVRDEIAWSDHRFHRLRQADVFDLEISQVVHSMVLLRPSVPLDQIVEHRRQGGSQLTAGEMPNVFDPVPERLPDDDQGSALFRQGDIDDEDAFWLDIGTDFGPVRLPAPGDCTFFENDGALMERQLPFGYLQHRVAPEHLLLGWQPADITIGRYRVSDNGEEALLEINFNCPGWCGYGRVLHLKSDNTGDWQVVAAKWTWVT